MPRTVAVSVELTKTSSEFTSIHKGQEKEGTKTQTQYVVGWLSRSISLCSPLLTCRWNTSCCSNSREGADTCVIVYLLSTFTLLPPPSSSPHFYFLLHHFNHRTDSPHLNPSKKLFIPPLSVFLHFTSCLIILSPICPYGKRSCFSPPMTMLLSSPPASLSNLSIPAPPPLIRTSSFFLRCI